MQPFTSQLHHIVFTITRTQISGPILVCVNVNAALLCGRLHQRTSISENTALGCNKSEFCGIVQSGVLRRLGAISVAQSMAS